MDPGQASPKRWWEIQNLRFNLRPIDSKCTFLKDRPSLTQEVRASSLKKRVTWSPLHQYFLFFFYWSSNFPCFLFCFLLHYLLFYSLRNSLYLSFTIKIDLKKFFIIFLISKTLKRKTSVLFLFHDCNIFSYYSKNIKIAYWSFLLFTVWCLISLSSLSPVGLFRSFYTMFEVPLKYLLILCVHLNLRTRY